MSPALGAREVLTFRDAETGKTSARLSALLDGPRALDHEALSSFLLLEVPPDGRTPYHDVRCEPAPSAWGDAEVEPPEPVAPARAPAALREVLRRAVAEAFGDARRVAVLAGGGVDSAALTALAVEHARAVSASVFVVALDFPSEGDDRPHLRALERALGVEVVRVSPADGVRHLAGWRRGTDGAPHFWPFAAVNVATYRAAAAHGAERVLTGAGGDHLFDGDPRALASLVARHPLAALRRARRLRGFDAPRSRVASWLLRPLVARLTPPRLRRALGRRRLARRALAPSWAGPVLRRTARTLAEARLELDVAPPPRHDVDRWLDDPDRRHFLWLVHQDQSAGGIPRFDPFFTRPVATFAASLPEDVLFAGDRRRGILREAMRGAVPDSVLDRLDKAQFSGAFDVFVRAAGIEAFRDLLGGEALASAGIVDGARFRAEAPRALASPLASDGYAQVWAALSVEAFLRARATA